MCGSLDPITKGHIALIDAAYEYLRNEDIEVDEILFIPSHDNYPYK